jgi:tetratricopeptide (TPR) repeat protein
VVDGALGEVESLYKARRYPEALAAARRAEGLLAKGEGHAELGRRVRQVVVDLEMVTTLEDIRLSQRGMIGKRFDFRQSDSQYERVFRQYGVDVIVLEPSEAAQRIHRKSIRVELAAALDDWAMARRQIGRKSDTSWKDLLALARAADGDELRGRLREALAKGDQQALERLTSSASIADLPIPTVVALGRMLRMMDAVPRAEAVLREAQRRHPDDFWINLWLAGACEDMQPPQWDESVRFYTAALAVRPGNALALNYLGVALYGKKRLDEATACFRKALDLNPNFAPAHHNFGNILHAKGELDDAIRQWRAAIALDPKFDLPHISLGNGLRDKGQVDEAIREYRAAIAIDPRFALAHSNLGNALRVKGLLDEAIVECRAAIDLNPKFAQARNNLGCALCDKKQLDKAIREYRIAIALDRRYATPHTNLGNALYNKTQLDEAIQEYRAAIELDPKDATPHNGLGNALLAKQQLDEAIQEYRKAIALDAKYARPRNGLANALRDKGHLDEAIKEYRAAIALDPNDATPHNGLGNALRDKRRPDDAIKEYRAAIALAPKFASPHNGLGIALKDKGQLNEAIASWKEAIHLDPKAATAHTNLGLGLMAKGQLDEAVHKLHAAIDLNRNLAQAHGGLGEALLQQGRFAEAQDATGRCLKLLPPSHPLRQVVTRQLERCKQRLALDNKLPLILEGKEKPADDAERLALARLCQERFKKLYAASARLYAEAFTNTKLADDLQKEYRYNAACAAALAGCRHGNDAEALGANERARLRRQAQGWLRADLAAWRAVLEKEPVKAAPVVAQQMARRLQDTDFAGVRGSEALARLPEEERQAWQKLWAEVSQLRTKARAEVPAPKK